MGHHYGRVRRTEAGSRNGSLPARGVVGPFGRRPLFLLPSTYPRYGSEGDPDEVLDQFVVEAEHADRVVDRDVVLYWTDDARRIVTGADIFGRLLEGIARRTPRPGTADKSANSEPGAATLPEIALLWPPTGHESRTDDRHAAARRIRPPAGWSGVPGARRLTPGEGLRHSAVGDRPHRGGLRHQFPGAGGEPSGGARQPGGHHPRQRRRQRRASTSR